MVNFHPPKRHIRVRHKVSCSQMLIILAIIKKISKSLSVMTLEELSTLDICVNYRTWDFKMFYEENIN
jgi:hypothetical protein